MAVETSNERMAPEIPGRVRRVLCERLAARVDSAASMVEAAHLVRGYCSKDPSDVNRLVGELERAFGIQLNATEVEQLQTVGELGVLIDERMSRRPPKERGYIIVYRNSEGGTVEAHVRAANHNEAVEHLKVEGLQAVLSVQREEDEDDDDRRYSRRRGRNGCLLPLLLALVAGALVVAFYWYRRH